MIRYVVGFLFNENLDMVALIDKRHGPALVIGKLNGVGGKIEKFDMDYYAAMEREFREEAGIDTNWWQHFAYIRGNGYEIDFFALRRNDVYKVRSVTDEDVFLVNVNSLGNRKLASHVEWLIPAAIEKLRYGINGVIHMDVDND